MNKTDNDIVRLLHSDGTYSDPMPRERAAFIVAFTMTGKRPKILEQATCGDCGEHNGEECNYNGRECCDDSEACDRYYKEMI